MIDTASSILVAIGKCLTKSKAKHGQVGLDQSKTRGIRVAYMHCISRDLYRESVFQVKWNEWQKEWFYMWKRSQTNLMRQVEPDISGTIWCLEWLAIQDVGWLVVAWFGRLMRCRRCHIKELGFEHKGNEQPLRAGTGMVRFVRLAKVRWKGKVWMVLKYHCYFPFRSIKQIWEKLKG